MTKKIDRLYEYLADEEDARLWRELSAGACRQVPGNFFAILRTQLLTPRGDTKALTLGWRLPEVQGGND